MLSFAFLSFLPLLYSLLLPVARRPHEFHLFRPTQNDTSLTVIRRTLVFSFTNKTFGFCPYNSAFFFSTAWAILIYCVLSCRIIASASWLLAKRALVTGFSVNRNRMEFRSQIDFVTLACPGETCQWSLVPIKSSQLLGTMLNRMLPFLNR